MNKLFFFILFILYWHASANTKQEWPIKYHNSAIIYDSLIGNSKDSLNVRIIDDQLVFRYKNKVISTVWSKDFIPMAFKGICITDGARVIKYQAYEYLNNICFVVPGENYWGELYVINKETSDLLIDDEFARNFLVSQSGLFVIDRENNCVISLNNPELNDRDELETKAFIFSIRGRFKKIGVKTCKGELKYEDELIISCFR